ncbi:ABC transporter permease [Sediminivirga luteola]|uniref:ABC3 transporter permease C-terminal domain-containing protein n=1 Tax=Sediminivirga luteola TaxID=1774748 RepID=A0A8J2TWX7_9MICO|nr:FtsX-like permease family protein [Sediminivirga luteola]GGA10222.1 hypothetical protein GCM10011333_11180 [Sediminivirga luteola]
MKALFAEALRSTLARPVSTGICGLVVAAVCLLSFLVMGRTAATEAQIARTFDSAGTRSLVVTDQTGNAAIADSAVAVIGALEGVDNVFGVGPAVTVWNPVTGPVTGQVTSSRPLIGGLPESAVITSGRAPERPSEAVIGHEHLADLSMDVPSGTVIGEGTSLAIVGTFSAEGPLSELESTVLHIPAEGAVAPLRYLYVETAEDVDVLALADTVEAAVPAAVPADLDVSVPAAAITLRDTVTGSLGASSRHLMMLILGGGTILVALTMIAAVSARRRDFGRLRALGATRLNILAHVLVQALVAGVTGLVAGGAAGLMLAWMLSGGLPSLRFALGLSGLILYSAILGALPPGILAALRDPVRILRVP